MRRSAHSRWSIIFCHERINSHYPYLYPLMKWTWTRHKGWIFLGLCLLMAFQSEAQKNPFDIEGRTTTPVLPRGSDTVSIQTSDTQSITAASQEIADTTSAPIDTASNQFDIKVDIPGDTSSIDSTALSPEVMPEDEDLLQETVQDSNFLLEELKEISDQIPEIEVIKNQNVLFIITVLILLLLAVLLAVDRSMINKAYRGIANDNFLRFLFREYKSMPWLYWAFYIYFFINCGLFLYLLSSYYGWTQSKFSILVLAVVMIAIIYLAKHFSLMVLSRSFPVEKETQLYSFVTMLINILLGIVLTPLNLIAAYAPEPFVKWALLLGVGIVVGLYLFRQLKGLFISGRFLHSYRFHFFLYLCTAEIAPLLIIGKLALNALNS